MKQRSRDPREAVRNAIRRHALTAEAIATRTGVHKTQVQFYLNEMKADLLVTGNPRRYRLSAIAQPDAEPSDFRVAGRIDQKYRGYRYGAGPI